MGLFSFLTQEVAVDLGTANTIIIYKDKIVVDDWEQCIHSDRVLARMHRAGLVDRESVHAEFGEIITGKKLGREHADERIFFNPFGLAIEDLAVAKVVYDRAVKAGLGTPIHLVDKEWDVLF